MIQLENKLYTSTEVASILGVSLRSVYRYLDEGSLNAEVKTATGRHRFTKKNILDFLYPDGEPQESSNDNYRRQNSTNNRNSISNSNTSSSNSNYQESSSNSNSSVNTATQNNISNSNTTKDEPLNNNMVTEDDDIDWLSKFRAAAEKFKQEDSLSSSREESSNNQIDSNDSLNNNPAPQISTKPQLYYYRSSLGGLKEIAQSIDKFAKQTGIDYAFTLNAGLSLHKPIKAFSLLHAYVRPGDLERLERLLSLTKNDDSTAQLCLIVSDNNLIYSTKETKHGLNVVNKNQLKEDVEEYSPDLRDDLYSIL